MWWEIQGVLQRRLYSGELALATQEDLIIWGEGTPEPPNPGLG
jgi:hypothetical protein